MVSYEAFEERKTAHEKEVKSTEKAGQKAKYYDVASGKSFKNLKNAKSELSTLVHSETNKKSNKNLF